MRRRGRGEGSITKRADGRWMARVDKEIQPFTPEQARTLLAAAKGHRLGAVVSVATALGLRLGEALG